MGKEKNTTEALEFARQFLTGNFPADIFTDVFKKAKSGFEKEFPLNHTDPKRERERSRLWKEVKSFTGSDEAITLCKAALITFLNLHLPYAYIVRQNLEEKKSGQYNENEINQEIVKFRDFLLSSKFYFELTHEQIEREIRHRELIILMNKKTGGCDPYQFTHNIEGVLELYRAFLRNTKDVDLRLLTAKMIAAFLSTIQQERAFNIKFGPNPSDLPFRALEFTIFGSVWGGSGQKNKSAELTALLINEYTQHNPLLKDYCQVLNETDVKNLWNRSKDQGHYISGKSPHEILR